MSRQDEHTENNSIEPIDLTVAISDYFRVLRRNWLLLLLVTAICAAGYAYYREYVYVPSYTASSTYVISTSTGSASGNYYDTSAAQQLAQTFPYIITSDILQRQVARQLHLDSIPGSVSAEVVPATNFLTISVTDTEPQRAYDTLQALLAAFPPLSESIIGRIYMELMDETGIPSAPVNTENFRLNLVSGGLFGLALTLFVNLAIILTNRTIRCEDDCIKRINTKCLGTIPRIRKKVRSKKTVLRPNILRKNADPEFTEAFRILRNKIDHRAGEDGMKSIIITSTFAGEGKSTIAVNTALALVQEGKKVALVDCDLRNPSDSDILGTPKGKGLVDFLKGDSKFEECLIRGEEFLPHKLPLLFIRGGSPVPDGSRYLANERLRTLIQILEKQMDYVILDTPPAGLLTDAGILSQYAQGAVYVVKQNFAKADKILEGMEHLTQANTDIIGCVLNGSM